MEESSPSDTLSRAEEELGTPDVEETGADFWAGALISCRNIASRRFGIFKGCRLKCLLGTGVMFVCGVMYLYGSSGLPGSNFLLFDRAIFVQ